MLIASAGEVLQNHEGLQGESQNTRSSNMLPFPSAFACSTGDRFIASNLLRPFVLLSCRALLSYLGLNAAKLSPLSLAAALAEDIPSLTRRVYGLEESLAKVLHFMESNSVGKKARVLTAALQYAKEHATATEDVTGSDVGPVSKKSDANVSREKLLPLLQSLDVSHPSLCGP